MRQGGAPPTGKWQGNPSGGVKAPRPVLLPDARSRFMATAARLDALADGNPMEQWLRFMAQLARAQHEAAVMLTDDIPPLSESTVQRAIEQRLAPLTMHERHPAWREGMRIIIAAMQRNELPKQIVKDLEYLRDGNAEVIDRLADNFLHGDVAAGDVSKALYAAAALQVYFASLASKLPAEQVRLLPERGLCPSCGSTPVAGIITATGDTPGTRYLFCSLCSTAWNHVRAICITCGGSRKLALRSIEGSGDVVRAESCGDCHTYAKMLYQAKDMQVDAFADDLATLGLDVLVSEAGWARHAPNPLLLIA